MCCSGTTNSNYVVVTYFIKFSYQIESNDSDGIFFEQENFFPRYYQKVMHERVKPQAQFVLLVMNMEN